MDATDLIDEIMLNTENLESLFELLENSIIELDKNTMNSRDRNKILRALGQFNVIMQSMAREYKGIDKKCNALWEIVVKLEK